ncbi:MAG: hypothetical protein V4615_12320 [Bacteroidota bacterium]
MFRIFFTSLFAFTFIYTLEAQPLQSISIKTDAVNLSQSVSKQAIGDVVNLLEDACKCSVQINNPEAEIQIILPSILKSSEAPSRFENNAKYPILHYPETDYRWTSMKKDTLTLLQLETKSYEGISCGLYGLLQEKLGFKFYHPRETIIPDLKQWTLPDNMNWEVKARFHKRGFHIHSQHPLELTEQLLDEKYPNAMYDIKQYLDWLARNGQNYFEFNLLEGINRKTWPAFAKEFVDYGHSRGILMGVDLSLHMIQQKAFQLYRSSASKKKQIERNMAMLNQAGWDTWDIEFSKTEFSSGNVKKKTELQLFITDQLTNKYHVKPMGRKHVVKASEELGKGEAKKTYELSSEDKELDKNRGILIHTVMFYNTFEEKAPVYRNKNLQHMLHLLLLEKQKRETWYYPESAYWITFDNSIPMTLLPYLKARLDDILLMDSLQIPGHITFSSGWEWGYWLTDWSIARWSWDQTENGTPRKNYPEEFMNQIFWDKTTQTFLKASSDLQQEYIKDRELIRYLTSATATDEFPEPFRLEFHPRPRWSYKNIRNKSSREVLDSIRNEAVQPLLEFYEKANGLVKNFEVSDSLSNELKDGMAITTLRAKHRAYTLQYLLGMRLAELNGLGKKEANEALGHFLAEAVSIRSEAMEIVKRREALYRYPIESIARRHKSHTAYNFGYLYPVSNLNFWSREEQQAKHNRWSPFYKNIFDLFRIIGIVN